MHDIDRTLGQDFGSGSESELGFELGFEIDLDGGYDGGGEGDLDDDGLNEEIEIDLAAELLSLQGDEDLDQFVGRLARRAGGAAMRAMRSPQGRAVGGALRGVAKRALPAVGAAIGTKIAPGIGTKIGGALGNAASQMFEIDIDAMEPEDAQFEVARRFVRFANRAVRTAHRVSQNPHVRSAARQVLLSAARQHAPGLARALEREQGEMPQIGGGRGRMTGGGGRGGRWIRRGDSIIVMGVR